MPLPVISQIWQVAIRYANASYYAVNVFNVHTTETSDSLIAFGVGEAFYAPNSLAQLQSSTMVCQDITVTKYDGASGGVIFPASTLALSNDAGYEGTPSTVPNVAGVITWRTGLAGRSFRGRSYIAGLAEGTVDDGDGVIEPSDQATWLAAPGEFMDQLDANLPAANLVIVSTISDGEPRDPALATSVTAAQARIPLRTQRRRVSRIV